MSDTELQTTDSVDSLQESASAPDSGEIHEQNTTGATSDTDAQGETNSDPSGFTKRIHQKHHEMMEEKRRADELAQRLKEVESKLPQETRPDIPAIPDPYDDDYEVKVEQRDRAILEAAQFDARQAVSIQQKEDQQRQAAIQKQQEAEQRGRDFVSRAKTGGITESELQTSIQTVASYGGVGDQVAEFIMGDDAGPAVTAYLASNPEEIMAIQTMNPLQAAVYVATTVKPKAAQKTVTATPSPADTLGGGGAPPIKRGPSGATFE